jgi:NAD(P)H-hydrate epimerase
MPEPRRPDEPDDILVFSRARVRDVDRLAVEEFGIPSIVLMENAAIGLCEVALEMLEGLGGSAALIACGPGNNGGDGLALARHLHNAGVEVHIVLAADPSRYGGDAAINLRIAQKMDLPLTISAPPDPGVALDRAAAALPRPAIIVDALLGTGVDRPVTGPLRTLIERLNSLRTPQSPVLAADLPSGLDADTGEPLGAAVVADATVTFVGLKPGFLTLAAQPFVGEIHIADIGAPAELVRRLGVPLPQESPPEPLPGRAAPGERREHPPGRD